jgi:hypothetical protein
VAAVHTFNFLEGLLMQLLKLSETDNQQAIENLADYIPFISNTVQIISTIT